MDLPISFHKLIEMTFQKGNQFLLILNSPMFCKFVTQRHKRRTVL